MDAGPHEGRVGLDSGVPKGVAIAAQALRRGIERLAVRQPGDPAMSVREQVLDAAPGAFGVVEQDRVGFHADRGPVEEDHRHQAGDPPMVGSRRNDQQRISAAAKQKRCELALALGVLLAGGREQQVAALVRERFHGLGDGRIERIGDVFDQQPERGRRVTAAKVGSEIVAMKAERGDRRDHPLGGLGSDPLAVEHSRNRLRADAGIACNVPDRRPPFSLSQAQIFSLTRPAQIFCLTRPAQIFSLPRSSPPTTLSDNVVRGSLCRRFGRVKQRLGPPAATRPRLLSGIRVLRAQPA